MLRANHKRAPLGLSFLLFETGSANDKSSLRPCETIHRLWFKTDQSFGKKCYVFWGNSERLEFRKSLLPKVLSYLKRAGNVPLDSLKFESIATLVDLRFFISFIFIYRYALKISLRIIVIEAQKLRV